ncbi:MAG: hypothetical protein VB855_07065 [Pirellulaceae bacterium]
MTSRQLWILLILVFLLCQPPGGLPAGKPPLSPRLEKSLLDDIPTSRTTDPETVGSEAPSSRTPPPPIVPAGEDLGRQGESDPLLPIELQMRQLHRRLLDGDTGRETQLLQIRLVEDLEGLLDSARSRQQERAGLVSGNSGQGSNHAGMGTSQGGNETTGDGQQVLDPPPDHLSPAIQRIWGSLPPEVRSELRGTRIERFLPKYESMLEQFYRRLSAPR